MVRLPQSSHGIANRPSRLIAKIDNMLACFARYDGEIVTSSHRATVVPEPVSRLSRIACRY